MTRLQTREPKASLSACRPCIVLLAFFVVACAEDDASSEFSTIRTRKLEVIREDATTAAVIRATDSGGAEFVTWNDDGKTTFRAGTDAEGIGYAFIYDKRGRPVIAIGSADGDGVIGVWNSLGGQTLEIRGGDRDSKSGRLQAFDEAEEPFFEVVMLDEVPVCRLFSGGESVFQAGIGSDGGGECGVASKTGEFVATMQAGDEGGTMTIRNTDRSVAITSFVLGSLASISIVEGPDRPLVTLAGEADGPGMVKIRAANGELSALQPPPK